MLTTATLPTLAEMLAEQGLEVDDGDLFDALLDLECTARVVRGQRDGSVVLSGRLLGWDRPLAHPATLRIETAAGQESVLPDDVDELTVTVELDDLIDRVRCQRHADQSASDASVELGSRPCSAVQFAEMAQALSQAGRREGLAIPVFRSPSPGRDRSLRRHADGTTTLLVTTRDRSVDDVAFDLVEGVLAANRQGNDERLFRTLITAVRGEAAAARAVDKHSAA